MRRKCKKEYNVRSFCELPAKVIEERETNRLKEFMPMVIVDLMLLSAAHDVIICESDIDYETVAPAAAHCVYLLDNGTIFDWFARPEHVHELDSVKNHADLSAEYKSAIIRNTYAAVSVNYGQIPERIGKHCVVGFS